MVCTFMLAVPLHAQETGEEKGRALLNQMVEALGGDAWLNRKGWILEGRAAGFFKNEPTGSELFWQFHKAVPGTAGIDRFEMSKKRDIIELWIDDKGYEITFKGKKELPKDIVDEHFRRTKHSLDEVARVWMKDPNAIVTYDGTGMVGRRQTDKVTIVNGQNDAVMIELDGNTHLPLRRSYKWRNLTYKDFDEDVEEYEDYHFFQGIPTALSITRYVNGSMVGQRFIVKAEYNPKMDDALFDPNRPYNKKK